MTSARCLIFFEPRGQVDPVSASAELLLPVPFAAPPRFVASSNVLESRSPREFPREQYPADFRWPMAESTETRAAPAVRLVQSSETPRVCDLRTIGSRFAEMLLTD